MVRAAMVLALVALLSAPAHASRSCLDKDEAARTWPGDNACLGDRGRSVECSPRARRQGDRSGDAVEAWRDDRSCRGSLSTPWEALSPRAAVVLS